jgi:hypothetical protein
MSEQQKGPTPETQSGARINNLRQWLQSNKVFFETIAAVALTLMSLMVSWKSLEISKEAFQVSKEAEDFAEAQVGPVFRTESANLYEGDLLGPPSEEDKRFLASDVWLRNDGQPTISWNVNYTTFLRLTGSGSKLKWVGLSDPIHMEIAYRDGAANEVPQVGQLAEFREERWFLEGYDAFLKHMYEGCDSGQEIWCRISKEYGFVTIARIDYVDKLGRVGKAPWYFVMYGGDRISHDQNDLPVLFERVQRAKSLYRFKQLATMKADELLKLAED